MKRRSFLAAATAAALSRPAFGQPANARTLIFVPQANLSSLDPIWTTATVTRNFGFLVYETLYGLDDKLNPQPQMVDGQTIEDGGRRWTMTLRDGLTFHDGSKVVARDCAASLQRWMKRDALGQTVAGVTDAIETPDDRTIVFRLKKPFAPLAFALAKTQPNPPLIMPERLAQTDPFKQITEVVGSGPFRFVGGEYVSGSRAVFAKYDAYKPRKEAPSFTAGAKRALVDRVEWRVIPDQSTATNALVAGEIDWLEIPLPDLIPQLKRARDVVVDRLDPYGLYPVMRPNHLEGPTTDIGLRQAMLAAVNPVDVMQAFMGDDASTYNAPIGCFLPGTPSANDAAMDRVGGKKSVDELKAMVKASGYGGEKIILMHPTDQPFYDAMSQVVASQLKAIGLNIDDQAMDWGTVVQRRASKAPLDKGGWSLFCTSFPAVDYLDPLSAPALRGNGGAAWYGWPNDPKIEQLRDAWLDSADADARKKLCADIQAQAFTNVEYIPLGQYFQSAAWRKNVTGHLKGPVPVFWNVEKT
ncbi:MAG TPA: ABC transporter substrate-binding protein [Acetobacteraceae bacterium]|jgi:peptide/nickel transport system substrate-binding protein|nr:ABC transporter substrate-binding protein [Acetobacteraceae bacterium]